MGASMRKWWRALSRFPKETKKGPKAISSSCRHIIAMVRNSRHLMDKPDSLTVIALFFPMYASL